MWRLTRGRGSFADEQRSQLQIKQDVSEELHRR